MDRNVHLQAVLVVLLVAAMIVGVVLADGCGQDGQVEPDGDGSVVNPDPEAMSSAYISRTLSWLHRGDER